MLVTIIQMRRVKSNQLTQLQTTETNDGRLISSHVSNIDELRLVGRVRVGFIPGSMSKSNVSAKITKGEILMDFPTMYNSQIDTDWYKGELIKKSTAAKTLHFLSWEIQDRKDLNTSMRKRTLSRHWGIFEVVALFGINCTSIQGN